MVVILGWPWHELSSVVFCFITCRCASGDCGTQFSDVSLGLLAKWLFRRLNSKEFLKLTFELPFLRKKIRCTVLARKCLEFIRSRWDMIMPSYENT